MDTKNLDLGLLVTLEVLLAEGNVTRAARRLNLFLGRYDFSLPDTVRNSGLRPLRNPNSAWEF